MGSRINQCRFPCSYFIIFTVEKGEMKKQLVLNAMKELPNDFQLEELIEKLLVIQKIEEGLADAKKGNVVGHKKAKQLLLSKS